MSTNMQNIYINNCISILKQKIRNTMHLVNERLTYFYNERNGYENCNV